jgi:hypothetical protein
MGARSALICGAAAVAALAHPGPAAAAPGPSAGAKVRVPAGDGSQGAYQSVSDQLSGDSYIGAVLGRCGHDRRMQDEPALAIDPCDTSVRASGSTGHCAMPAAGNARAGFCRSTGGGSSWTGSPVPGYDSDTSAQGLSSPLHQLVAGGALADDDPMMARGDPHYLGDSFNRGTQNGASGGTWDDTGSIWVAPCAPSDPASPATDGSCHVHTIVLTQNTLGKRIFSEVLFSRSADHGATSSAPLKISSGSAGIRPLDRDRVGRAAPAGRD